MRPARRMRRFRVELGFERGDEHLEQVEHQRVRVAELRAHRLLDDRTEHQGPPAFAGGDIVDPPQNTFDLFRRVDVRHRHALKFEVLELRQQAVAQHFGRNAGAIGNKKNRARVRHRHQSFQTGVMPAGRSGMSPRSARLSPGP